MSFYYTYELNTGLIVAVHQQDSPPDVKDGKGVIALEEFIDVFNLRRAVVTHDQSIRMIPKPDEPGSTWNGERWIPYQPSYDDLVADAQAAREKLFSSTSWYVERFVETGIPIPPEISAFRQALRDMTLQPGYPFDFEFPQLKNPVMAE